MMFKIVIVMENSEKKIHNFLTRHGMSAEQIDLNQCLADYIDEMEAGLDGRESSLLMLPSYILLKKISGKARRIVAVDAGGTNLRVGLVSSDENGHCRVEQINKYRMPGAQGPITSDEFFAALAEYIGVFTPETKTIAISFAYPAQIMPDLDGRIIGMVKEVQISGIEGCLLGRRLAASLAEAGHSANAAFM